MSKKKTVLVADDDDDILDVTRIILEVYGGYQVKIVDRGEALLNLKDELPDLILLDLWLSGHNGQEICSLLKEDERTKAIPIIIFSANRDLEKLAKDCGAEDFLSKPFQMEDLLEKVAAWI